MKITRFLIVALLSLSAAHAELVRPDVTATDEGSLSPESGTYKINGKWLRNGIFTTPASSTQYGYYGLSADSSQVDQNIYLGDPDKINDNTGLQLTTGGGAADYNKVDLASTENTYIYGGNFAKSELTIHNSKIDNATANLTIYGGSFHAIAGSFANTGLTQNVNIEMYGGQVASKVWTGIYGGNALNATNGGLHDTKGSINIKLGSANGQSAEVTFVAGGSRCGLNHTGDIAITIENGARTWGAIGGNIHVDDSVNTTSTVTGNTSVTINGGIINNDDIGGLSQNGGVFGETFTASGVIGGGVNGGGVTGTSTVNILGTSEVYGSVIGSSLGTGTSNVNKSVINISGGTVDASGEASYGSINLNTVSYQNGIYGGGVAIITRDSGSNITTGSTEINISGGQVTGNIYGGGNAQGYSAGGFFGVTQEASSIVDGDTHITIGSNEQVISIDGDIYGGGNRGTTHTGVTTSIVTGDSYISLVGKGENLDITGTIYGGGDNGATVAGEKILSFGTSEQTFSGSFDNVVSDFTSIVVDDGSNVVWENYTGADGVEIATTDTGSITLVISDIFEDGDTIIGYLSGNYTIDGGTYSDGVITVSKSDLLHINTPLDKTLNCNMSYTLVDEGKTERVTLKFNQSEGEGTAVLTSVYEEDNIGALTHIVDGSIVAYDFDVTLGDASSALVTLALGDATYDEGFSIWYQDEGGLWHNVTDDLEGIIHNKENNTICFVAENFSSYAITEYSEVEITPEPSTATLSLIALTSLLMRRRRRQQQA